MLYPQASDQDSMPDPIIYKFHKSPVLCSSSTTRSAIRILQAQPARCYFPGQSVPDREIPALGFFVVPTDGGVDSTSATTIALRTSILL
jgi:hypothetical protein